MTLSDGEEASFGQEVPNYSIEDKIERWENDTWRSKPKTLTCLKKQDEVKTKTDLKQTSLW